MLIIVAHEETCDIIVQGPTTEIIVQLGEWRAGAVVSTRKVVSTVCTCGGTRLEYRLNARGTYGWYPYENNG